jgi:beta-lactamase regulating signal transducer with metallopeptidase domain
MTSLLCLHFAGVVLSYSLQLAMAYGTCRLLNCLLSKPQQRFFLWMVFLLGSGTYWLGLIWSEVRALPRAAAGSSRFPAGAGPGWLHPLLIPPNWSPGVLIACQAAALAYVCAVVLLIGLAGWRHLQLRWLLRRGMEPSAALASLFQAICRDFKSSRCRLLVLPGLRSPATACWWRPRILLPEICEELGPTSQLTDVLHHELVHVARHDYLWAGISDLICRLLFFHPAVWQARKHLRLEGELACDMAVVEARPCQRADYADSLAYFVRLRMLEEGASVGVDFAASASTLGLRIRAILAPPQPLSRWKQTSQMIAALTLVSAAALLLPALNVLLDFAHPAEPETVSQPQTLPPAPTVRHRHPRLTAAREARPALGSDSLTTLRVQPLVRETSVYGLTATTYGGSEAEPADVSAPRWSDSGPPVRTVSSIVQVAIRQIPVGRSPHPRDRDHDGDER